ncbi:MAG: hypothetical protein JXD22_10390 [Sedimentisphaerales bacterium]|nr:hypothetical protein [Sedimentisphaerales bacterium]
MCPLDEQDPWGDPIPLEDSDDEEEAQPVQLEQEVKKEETKIEGLGKIRTFKGTSLSGVKEESSFKRPLVKGGGATRVRTFHTKMSDNAMHYLDGLINEWLDAHEDVEVKFSNTTVGVVEGKKSEPHLITTIWY